MSDVIVNHPGPPQISEEQVNEHEWRGRAMELEGEAEQQQEESEQERLQSAIEQEAEDRIKEWRARKETADKKKRWGRSKVHPPAQSLFQPPHWPIFHQTAESD